MANLARSFPWRPSSGDLLGAQSQDHFQSLYTDLMDDGLDHLAGGLNEVDDGKQNLPVALAELLDDGGTLARSASHNVVRFLHGGWLLSGSCLATGFYRNRATRRLPTLN
jgi:hypothetical protein